MAVSEDGQRDGVVLVEEEFPRGKRSGDDEEGEEADDDVDDVNAGIDGCRCIKTE